MVHIIESNEKEKTQMQWAAARLCIGKKSALFVNAECLTAAIAEHILQIPYPVVVYALRKWTLLSSENKKLLFPLLSWNHVGTMPGYPFSLREMYRVYHALGEGKSVSNAFVVESIRGGAIRMLRASISALRTREEVVNEVVRVEKAYGIRVRAQEVMGEYKGVPAVAPPLSEDIAAGVFCVMEDTLFYPLTRNLNKSVVVKLHELEREGRHIVLMTNEDVEIARNAVSFYGVKDAEGKEYAVVPMRHYAGKKVGHVIGPLPELLAFQERYRIFPQKYIKM